MKVIKRDGRVTGFDINKIINAVKKTMKAENKATDYFKMTIQSYLEQRAQTDELFAPVYAKPNKNIDDCILWIAIHKHHYAQYTVMCSVWKKILFPNQIAIKH